MNVVAQFIEQYRGFIHQPKSDKPHFKPLTLLNFFVKLNYENCHQ